MTARQQLGDFGLTRIAILEAWFRARMTLTAGSRARLGASLIRVFLVLDVAHAGTNMTARHRLQTSGKTSAFRWKVFDSTSL